MTTPLPGAEIAPDTQKTQKRQARLTEAFLLLFVLLALFSGAWQVVLAKSQAAPTPASVVNLNTATGPQIARVLGVPSSVGERLVANRSAQTGGVWGDVDALGRVPLVPKAERATIADKLRAAQMPSPLQATRSQVAGVFSGAQNKAVVDRIIALCDAARKSVGATPAKGTTAKAAPTWERLLASPLVTPGTLADANDRFVVRTWASAAQTFWRCVLCLAGFLVLAHLAVRQFRPTADPFLLPIAGLLSVFGLLLLFALKDPTRDMLSFLEQTKGVIGGGSVALVITLSSPFMRLPLHRYGYIYAVAAVLGTFLLGIAGVGPGGVRLSVAGAQPVEVIKILLVFFLAAYLADRGALLLDPLRKIGPLFIPRKNDVLPLVVLYGLPLVLFALVKDLGPVLLLFGAFLLLLYLATSRGFFIALGILALLLGGFVGYKLRFGVFETRVDMWLSPWANTHKLGEHLVSGLWGLASGGPWGSGLALGGTHFIPRGGSDSALAAWGEETGLWGTLGLCLCFFTIAQRGLRIARRASTDFDRYLVSGLSGLMALQAVVIIAGNLGILPLTGITLPFLSYGKSSMVASFFTVGLLLMLSARASDAAVTGANTTYQTASRRVFAFFALCLGLLLPLRLWWVQELGANAIATRTVKVPDADNVSRPHTNPRLLLLANHIGRGRILDREKRILAETRDGKRVYPYGPVTAHLIGYVDPAIGGPTGLEKTYADQLRGFDGYADLIGYWRRKDLPGYRPPQSQDVTLALDAELQKQAVDILRDEAAQIRDRRTGRRKNKGAVVALDVQTGGVLCAATLPTYDPTNLKPSGMRALSADLNGDSALLNRALSGFYPPGSTFKVVSATSLLTAQKAAFTVNCNHAEMNVHWTAGGVNYARRRVVDDEGDRPHGNTDLSRAIEESCNVYFARAGIALGPTLLSQTAQSFGFSHLPTQKQFEAELPDIAYGQGPMLASPMEMAGVAQTVANNGVKLKPDFLLHSQPTEKGDTILSSSDAEQLARMLRGVTESGTAAGRFNGLPYAVAGKTGTAQNGSGDKVAHSWFIGFAPADKPRVAFAVLVENGGYGASVAVPIARRVLQAEGLRP